jgi:excinuclease ABC subunit C
MEPPHERLKSLPEEPGVYLMKDLKGQVIYVGKARSLKNRVSSYFLESRDRTPRISLLVKNIRDFDFLVTGTEMEALILEFTLIKRYRPYFNVRFKDDKRYPLLEITLDERFPCSRIVRKKTGKKNRVFGPYTSTDALRKTLTLMRRVFQLRTCKPSIFKRKKPCLNYQIGQCCAPCAGFVSEEEYRKRIDAAMLFLGGHSSKLLRDLRRDMELHSKKLNFELCARILISIQSIEKVVQKQKVLFPEAINRDYIAIHTSHGNLCAEVLTVREGKLTGEFNFLFSTPEGMAEGEKIRSFIMDYYQRGLLPPPRIYVTDEIYEKELLEEWLQGQAGKKVCLITGRGGKNGELLKLAEQNALHHFTSHVSLEKQVKARNNALMEELRRILSLQAMPMRMETYDISNIMGKHATGSMIVFTGGEPDKSEYRHFRIESKDTPDDPAMMREMLTRRFTIAESEKKDIWKTRLPDLVVLDGGRAQLQTGREVIREKGFSIPIVSLAKRYEEIFTDPRSAPLVLPKDSPVLHVFQHMRDESHRFALAYHRKLRAKAFTPRDRKKPAGATEVQP